jgi:AraC-like DNA-binding protein
MPKKFSTSDVHPRERLSYRHDFVCDALVQADAAVRPDRPFFGEIRVAAAGELRVAECAGTVQSVTRSRCHIARDRADSLALGIQHLGGNGMSQDGRDAVLGPSDFALLDMTRPWRIGINAGFAQTVPMFPRSALLRRLGAVEPYIGRRIDGATGVGGMLSPLLRAMPAHLDTIPATARERVADNVLDLMATALSQVERPLPAATTLVRVKLWIETHLGERLTAERIAAACRSSARQLNRLFEREGTSLMHYVWDRRLARCHCDLADPAMRGRPITEIAFGAGFNDPSHFSQAYRARYGCAPRDTRRSHEGASPGVKRVHTQREPASDRLPPPRIDCDNRLKCSDLKPFWIDLEFFGRSSSTLGLSRYSSKPHQSPTTPGR